MTVVQMSTCTDASTGSTTGDTSTTSTALSSSTTVLLSTTTDDRSTQFTVTSTSTLPFTTTDFPANFCRQDLPELCVRTGETLIVPNGTDTFDGDVKVQAGGVLVLSNSSTLTITGNAVIDGALNFTACNSGVVSVLSTTGGIISVGSGSSLNPTCPCASVSVTSTQITSTSLSVTVMAQPILDDPKCTSTSSPAAGGEDRLSTGAIVGISIGAIIGGVGVAVAAVLITQYMLKKSSADAAIRAKAFNMQQMGAGGGPQINL